eukprot:gene5281-21001_t
MPRVEAENVLRSCGILYFHFCFGLALIALGAAAVAARLPFDFVRRRLRPWHAAMGQSWLYGVIVQIALSLYCRNDGFRPFIFGFLVILVVNMIIAHASIRVYQRAAARRCAPAEHSNENIEQSIEKLEQLEGAYIPAPVAAGPVRAGAAQARETVCGVPVERYKYVHGPGAFFILQDGDLVLAGANASSTEL